MFRNSLVGMSSVFAQSMRGKWCIPEPWHLAVTTSVAGQLPQWENLQSSGAGTPLKLPGCVCALGPLGFKGHVGRIYFQLGYC